MKNLILLVLISYSLLAVNANSSDLVPAEKEPVNCMQAYEDLKQLVAEIESDINKAEGGNKAAGTRVRKQMQAIKQAAQNVRNTVLEIRSSD